ncbi:MAG TPA: hypothetical protein VF727_05175 [Allosphingosinicella sp.]|jgi:hypothetical protein
MSEDRLALILARQKQAHDQRTAALEDKRRRELEKDRRVQQLLETWNARQGSLKAVIAELNGAMRANGVTLRYQEQTSLVGARHSAEIGYVEPHEYIATGLSLRLFASARGLLTITIVGMGRPIKNDQMKLTDFSEEVQRTWLLDFLEATAEAETERK